ncbi:MAG: hypothetical protein WBX19_19510 [Terracidiphilus sp.]
MSKARIKTYARVWDAIADTPEEAANLRMRAALMQQIAPNGGNNLQNGGKYLASGMMGLAGILAGMGLTGS